MHPEALIDRLSAKIDQLKNHPNFSVGLDFIDPPKTNKELAKVLKTQSLPQELLKFYAVSDGILMTAETTGLRQKMAYAFELRSADLVRNPEVGLHDDLSAEQRLFCHRYFSNPRKLCDCL